MQPFAAPRRSPANRRGIQRAELREQPMSGLIYLVGLIVVILAILSFFGLR
jgi:hypothetical protein